MRRRILLFFWLFLFSATVFGKNPRVVTYVYDGDTIKVGEETVRLLGVDAPEVAWKKYGKKGECYGPEAKAYLEKRVLGKRVKLQSDPKADSRDKYGRTLAYVSIRGRLINQELIRQGYAQVLRYFPFTKKQAFLRQQEKAIAERRGLWKSCLPESGSPGSGLTEGR